MVCKHAEQQPQNVSLVFSRPKSNNLQSDGLFVMLPGYCGQPLSGTVRDAGLVSYMYCGNTTNGHFSFSRLCGPFVFLLQDAFIKIIRGEGMASLWSGLPPTL